MSAASSDQGGLKWFSGENEDAKEYRRWKAWVQAKMLTLDKMPKEARGAYVFTLLSGKALECVEHLDPSKYQVEGGDKTLFDLLDARFPQKEMSDEMSEALTEIFGLRAREGETLKAWISRATEQFDKCARKTNVVFPEEARGWLILHRSGLTEEQKAVVMARSLGVLKREESGKAMRSVYPEYVVKRKTVPSGAAVVENEFSDSLPLEEDQDDFADVEQFLAELQPHEGEDPDLEAYEEEDVKEALAISWKDKRNELNKLQKARRFAQAGDVRRSFRVEVEELKRKTKCHRCGQVGHWSKECRVGLSKGKGKGKNTKGTDRTSEAGAAYVAEEPQEFFIAMVQECHNVTLSRLRERATVHPQCNNRANECLLVSSPGYGVIDSGCGKTIVGRDTLLEFEQLWREHDVVVPTAESEVNHFRFGNGHKEVSTQVVPMPVEIAGKQGVIRAAVVQGKAPLLISRSALQRLNAVLDFRSGKMTLFEDQSTVPLEINAAGQFMINVLKQSPDSVPREPDFKEVMSATQFQEEESPLPSSSENMGDDVVEPAASAPDSQASDSSSGEPVVWSRFDSGLTLTPITGKNSPMWQTVFRRVIQDLDTGLVIFDQKINPQEDKRGYLQPIPKHVVRTRTDFHFVPQEALCSCECLPVQIARKLTAIVRDAPQTVGALLNGKRFLVAEVFSPPRFSPLAEDTGFIGKSYDLKTGCDFRKQSVRDNTKLFLRDNPPDLLVLCPPCTHEGGWFHLNASKLSAQELLKIKTESRMFIRFCMELFEQQVKGGKQAIFEHPLGAKTWSYPEVQRMCAKYFPLKCHMCRFGLKLPSSTRYIRKATQLLTSHEHMKSLGLECPGKQDPHHSCHDVIAGSCPSVGSISQFTAQYTPAFVRAVLQTVRPYVEAAQAKLVDAREVSVMEVHEVLVSKDDLQGEDVDQMKKALLRLHKNLGHPSVSDLVRILKHGSASDRAIELARTLSCDFCKANIRPHVPLPARSSRVTEFNHSVGVDVKWLRGWKVNQQVKSLNIVDQGSCFQQVIPFFEQETSTVLRSLFDTHWTKWAGPPKEMFMDQARANLGEAFQGYLDDRGVTIRTIPAEAHWQLGRTESHGGWFARILDKIITEHSPSNQAEWEECVRHAHVKNQMIQNYGHTPHQHVFGKNPELPGDLLNEPLHVVPGTAGLTDDAVARAQAIRTTARQAVIAMQDDKALRQALAARPRAAQTFNPGDLVCYWRAQKIVGKGVIQQGGRWYGTAVAIGQVGKNWIIAHRRQIFRCAPEQLRLATTEEKVLVSSPQAELLGIKDLLEGGTFRSHQFVDLVPGHYPMEESPRETHEDVTNDPVPNQQSSRPVTESSPDAEMPDKDSGPDWDAEQSTEPSLTSSSSRQVQSTDQNASSYGPIRRRVEGKSGSAALFRPPAMRQEDFLEMIRELVPPLIDKATENINEDPNMERGTKRSLSPSKGESESAEPVTSKARQDDCEEALLIQEFEERLASGNENIEVLMATYLEKKLNKELKPSNNPPELQKLIDESKGEEWTTLSGKQAVRLIFGKKALQIKAQCADRFIGSRFVIIRKAIQDGVGIDVNDPTTFKIKSRWVVQGHLEPDLELKATEGLLQSPTLSQLGRMTIMQIISSQQWTLQLGDIKGAFLEADQLPAKYRPLYAKMPPGGIPGVPDREDVVIEVLGNIYGQNDAPRAWHQTFDREAVKLGWTRSILDPCLYTLRCPRSQQLTGVLGIHVDDTVVGGTGPEFENILRQMKERFPFRKWRVGNGEFCGAMYMQCDKTKEITMSQASFVDQLKPASIPKGVPSTQSLSEQQTRVLRAINGSLNWLSSQSRPDLKSNESVSTGIP